jgi:hypothetical protein
MFEHYEAATKPFGGGTISHSLIRPAHWAPSHDVRFTLGAFLDRRCGASNLPRVGAVGWPVFEHCEAFLTLLSGGTITHSLIRPAHMAPYHDIRYLLVPSWEPSGAYPQYPRIHILRSMGYTRIGVVSVGRCLSISKHT